MGRVSDAMWRAESQTETASGAIGDDVPFVSSEDGEAASREVGAFVSPTDDGGFVSGQDEEKDLAVYVFNPSERTTSQPREPLALRPRTAPIERVRNDSGSAEDVKIVDAITTLYRHRWLMAVVMAAAVAAAGVYNYRATPIYEARARLIIEPNSAEVVPFRGPSTEDQGRLDYFNTQIEVLRSRALALKTLERLPGPAGEPKATVDQVSRLIGGLSVTPVKSDLGESRVLNLSYRSSNPSLAAQIVNGIADTYVDQNLEARRQGSLDAFKLLNQRLAELRNDVSASQGAMQHYREQKDSVSLGDQQNIVGQKLAQLNTAVTTARMERVEKQTLYEQLKKIQESGAPSDSLSSILSNQFIQGLKAELAGLLRDRAQMAERLGDAHPDMIKINSSIASAERRLHDEMAKIVEGIENDYRGAEAREKAMNSALESQKREVLELSQKSIGFNALQRDAASTQQMFDTVLQRVKETELSGGLQTNNAKILDRAEIPRSPISPRKELNLIVALVGGAIIAIGLALSMEYLNPRLARPDDITVALGLPLLGSSPKIQHFNALSSISAMPPAFQEAFRTIRTRILLSPVASAARALAVTSTNVGEGKSVVASNLAASMAAAGRRVLLVDADLRRPQLHHRFRIRKSPGLSDVLMGRLTPSEALIESTVPGLFLLTAGTDMASSGDALDSQRLAQLIQGFEDTFDLVVLDCPPVMPVADATIIAHAAASVLFVVGSGTTARATAQVALDRLTSVQAQVVGVVLNKARPDSASAYHYQPSLTEHPA